MAHATLKTVWKSTAIPQDCHDYGKLVALADRRPLGEIIGDILQPVLKERHDAAVKILARNGGVKFKRQRGDKR